MNQPHRSYRAVERYMESLATRGKFSFSLAEACDATGLSRIAAKNQILHLRSRVVRASPKQQFFLIVTPEHRLAGAPPIDWWLHDYFRWLERPYYVALLSAAALYGSEPQAVQAIQVMTNEPRREITPGRLRIQFFVKRNILHTPTQQAPGARGNLLVSTPEATALDLVAYSNRIGGVSRALETLQPLLHDMQVKRMRQAVRGARDIAVKKLTRAVSGDKPAAKAVRKLLG